METIAFLIIFIAVWKTLKSKKKNRMAYNQRFKYELRKTK